MNNQDMQFSCPYQFPDPRLCDATQQLIAQGADLAPATIWTAYRQGLFPWFNADEPILWWSPNPRCIIQTNDYHPSKSLLRILKKNAFDITTNRQFNSVMQHCGHTRAQSGTWISDAMIESYTALFELGFGYSIEIWQRGILVGGLYGLTIGGAVFGESMFSAVNDASKVAFSALMYACQQAQISWVDCQVESPHILSLGAHSIDRNDYLDLLEQQLRLPEQPWLIKTLSCSALADYFSAQTRAGKPDR